MPTGDKTYHRVRSLVAIFASDPMHGNTRTSSAYPGVKTRHMHDIVSEISASLRIHQELGSRLGGVHLELTGDINDDGMSVTECLGGSMRLEEEQLALRFESYCDRACPSIHRLHKTVAHRLDLQRDSTLSRHSVGLIPPLPPRSYPPFSEISLPRPSPHHFTDPTMPCLRFADIAFMLSQAGGRSGRGDTRIFEELASRPQSLDSRAL